MISEEHKQHIRYALDEWVSNSLTNVMTDKDVEWIYARAAETLLAASRRVSHKEALGARLVH